MICNQEGMIRNEISKMGCNQEGTIMNENTPKEETTTRSGQSQLKRQVLPRKKQPKLTTHPRRMNYSKKGTIPIKNITMKTSFTKKEMTKNENTSKEDKLQQKRDDKDQKPTMRGCTSLRRR